MIKNLYLINVPAPLAATLSIEFPNLITLNLDSIDGFQQLLQMSAEDTVIMGDCAQGECPFFIYYDVIFKLLKNNEIPHIVYLSFHVDRCFYELWNNPELPKVFLGTPGYEPRIVNYMIARHQGSRIDSTHLWSNEVEMLLAAFRLPESYDAYPIWRDILFRSRTQFSPYQSVYDDILGTVVSDYATSVSNAERSLRHMLQIFWSSPYRSEWAEALATPFWGSRNRRPTLTDFYRACFYYLRRRMEQITLQ